VSSNILGTLDEDETFQAWSGSNLRPDLAQFAKRSADLVQTSQPAEDGALFCHSERSEESLFGLNVGKEGFLGAQRASE
jgi:hypothetical protein